MALTKIVDATVEPVTLAEAKAHCRVDSSDDDAYLTTLITVARTAAEDRTQRTLMTTTWRLLVDAFPDAIKLPMPRIIGVSSVQYVATDGTIATLDPGGYTVDTASEPGWVVPSYEQEWPEVRERQAETSEARRLLSVKPDISIGGARDVRLLLGQAPRSALLLPVLCPQNISSTQSTS